MQPDIMSYDSFRAVAASTKRTKLRPSWDEYFMAQALSIASRSACLRRSVGAVIVRDRQIISTGYNGPPSEFDHAESVGCYREAANIPSGFRTELCRGLHAEQNALLLAAKRGLSVENGVIYCTHSPCITCQKMIIGAGIKEVIYYEEYAESDLISAEASRKGLLLLRKLDETEYLKKLSEVIKSLYPSN